MATQGPATTRIPATSADTVGGDEDAGILTRDSNQLYLSAVSSVAPLSSFPSIASAIPASKHIPKTRFVIDFFRFPPTSDLSAIFFLSHFHSDHYSGLSPSWCRGIIFCSEVTARLLNDVMQIPSRFICPLPLGKTLLIDGCEVILVDANHCPGAVQLLFKVPLEKKGHERYIHTGDFRYCESMRLDPFLNLFIGCDGVFLDTTYCNPKFVFPTQEESVDYVCSVVDRVGGEFSGLKKRVLFLVATYVVGKEKLLVEIARRCKRKIYVDAKKMWTLRVLGYGKSGVFTEDENESDVHVVGWNVLGETWPYFRPNFVRMKEIMTEKGYDNVVGFVPTGWTYEVKRNKFSVRSKDSFEIHLVPYSEHSNYNELREYVKFLKPKRVIPTVGVDVEKLDSKQVSKMQKHFSGLVDEMANKKEFLMGFYRGFFEIDEKTSIDVGVSREEEVDQEREKMLIEAKDSKSNMVSGILDFSSLPQERSSKVSTAILDDLEMEKILHGIRDSFPTWVTRDQVLDLIRRFRGNVVDVVNNFYEHETEFYEQVSFSTSSGPEYNASLPDNKVPHSQQSFLKSTPRESLNVSNEVCMSYSKLISMKSSSSPIKRKKRVENKPNKKVKSNPKLEPMCPKQSMITKFFNKLKPTEECLPDENMALTDDGKSHKEGIDQFIEVVNGSDSLRSYAASILEKSKGDLNSALDIYYGNPEQNFGNQVEKIEVSTGSVQVSNDCSLLEDKTVSEEPRHINGPSLQRPSTENVDTTLVSLPPEKYKPVEHACWKDGQPAPYIHIVRTFNLVEGEKGKIKAMSMLCNMFRSLLALSPEDVLPAVYLCTNKIAADHENIELNVGGSLITSALEEACGTSRSTIRDMYNNLGDLGDVAQLCRQTQKLLAPPPPLRIRNVFATLRKISVQTGSGSTVRKKSLMVNLMCSCREKEIKFLVRTLVRNLRIGAMMRTVLPALAQAIVMNFLPLSHIEGTSEVFKDKLQSVSAAVVEAYNVLPSLDVIVPSLMDKGIEFSSSTLSMVPGIPIKPMLAKITNGVPEVMKLFQSKSFTCEYKYDGQRAQIHKLLDGTVRIFSRNGDETTSRFPDLIDTVNKFSKPVAKTFILDTEVVAVDRKKGCKLMSFQELSRRERGSKDSLVSVDRIKVDICVYVFDIMFANGQQLLCLPLCNRRKWLQDLFLKEKSGYFEYAKEITVEAEDACLSHEGTLTRINTFLDKALQSSCEGIMAKSLDDDARYSPSKRTDTWLKVKRDYVEGLNDSLDLVPIGGWHGNGRKAGWYSPFLMACFNPETEDFQSVCRVMSGFSDSFYIEMKEFYSGDKILTRKPTYYRTAETPDMWFSPELVWEIRGADFTVSPVHQAALGLVHPSRGISIRFPRFIRMVTDRKPEECSTASDIAEMFNAQTRKMDLTSQH